MTRDEVIEAYENMGATGILVDGHDDAILGIGSQFGGDDAVVYSVEKIVSKLVAQGMSEEEAEEYFAFNIKGAYVGDPSPIYVYWTGGEREEVSSDLG